MTRKSSALRTLRSAASWTGGFGCGLSNSPQMASTCAKFEQNRLWESMWWYATVAQFSIKWELSHLSEEDQRRAFPLLDKQARGDFDITHFDEQDLVIVGTPDECLEKFLKYEEAGVDQILCYTKFGYLPHEAVMKSIELLGDPVIPELKRCGARRMAESLGTTVRLRAAGE